MELLSLALLVALVGSALLHRLPGPEFCSHCPHCRQAASELARTKQLATEEDARRRHLLFHRAYGMPWGSSHCPYCVKGGERDEPRE